MVALRSGEPQLGVVMGIETPTEERRWISINAEPLRHGPGESPYAVVTTFSNVTALRETERRYRLLFENLREDLTVFRVERDATGRVVDWRLLESNAQGRAFFGDHYSGAQGRRITELVDSSAIRQGIDRSAAILSGDVTTRETVVESTGASYLSTLFALDAETIVAAAVDITERVRVEAELRTAFADNERTLAELRSALAEVRTLSGLLPICMYCKKIRDDSGYWARLEEFIGKRSEATFSHGMCPDCYDRYAAPELARLEADIESEP